MTKNQKQAIANLWAAATLIAAGMDSFDDDVSYDDAGDIVNRVNVIGIKLLGHHKQINSLPEIIAYVLKNVK